MNKIIPFLSMDNLISLESKLDCTVQSTPYLVCQCFRLKLLALAPKIRGLIRDTQ